MAMYFGDGELDPEAELSDEPSGVRYPPLGADQPLDNEQFMLEFDNERLRELEEQQEKLNSSLMSLTSHFAQVQLRLKQIVDAPAEDKQQLLRQLEEFAFRGIPDIPAITSTALVKTSSTDSESTAKKQRDKQRQLIEELKSQLEELEHYAYEMGEAGLPQSLLVEKQQIIIDELKGKLNLNVENMDRLSIDDIKCQVDSAIDQLTNPIIMKEQLVIQLKTQIMDLERFIDFLQGDSEMESKTKQNSCSCKVHTRVDAKEYRTTSPPRLASGKHEGKEEAIKKTISMIRRAATLLQLFTISQFGCGGSVTTRPSTTLNTLKKTMRGNHWGDLRAKLEVAVVSVLSLVQERNREVSYDDYSSDTESGATWGAKLARTVRKQLAICIRDLIHHGLVSVEASTSLVPIFGCFPLRERDVPTMHAWELILQYYHVKNGPSFNELPARKLSESFNLSMVGSTGVGHKHGLLSTVGHILSLHTKFKRSYDAQFKAFICTALNCNKLVIWLRLVFRCQHLIDTYYEPWSYMAQTKFDDSLQSLDKLTRHSFYLPVDTAVHHFQNIRDAF